MATFTRKALGLFGELEVLRQLPGAYLPRGAKCGDVHYPDPATGAVTRIEVKTARRDSEGRFQFCLYRKINGGRTCTDCRYSDVVVLLAVEADLTYRVYVVPKAALPGKTLVIANPATTKYRQYERAGVQL